MINLTVPFSEEIIRSLNVGDQVSISGRIVTGRDAAHTWLLEKRQEAMVNLLKGSALYHCGPVVKKENGNWCFVAAGPTTSIREEPYECEVIKQYGVKAIIGKGGMGEKTSQALKEHGAVYLHAIGGLGTLIARSVSKIYDVFNLKEFGIPEASWVIEVKDFVTIVTMDSHGNSLHDQVKQESEFIKNKILELRKKP